MDQLRVQNHWAERGNCGVEIDNSNRGCWGGKGWTDTRFVEGILSDLGTRGWVEKMINNGGKNHTQYLVQKMGEQKKGETKQKRRK